MLSSRRATTPSFTFLSSAPWCLAQHYYIPHLATDTYVLMSECWVLKFCSIDRRCFIFREALTMEPCQPVSTEAELTGAESTGWSHQERDAVRAPGQLLKVPVAVANHRQINPRGCTESCTGREGSKGRALCSPFGGSS